MADNDFQGYANFIWSIADLIRDDFKRSKYQDVILPLTVLRRIDCVLEPTKADVLKTYNLYQGKLNDLNPLLQQASGYAFYNTSNYTFETLLADAKNLARNLKHYKNGFSPNMLEVLEKFEFDKTIDKLEEAGALYQVLKKFSEIDLHPNVVSNITMGKVFEELIRKFNEALNENPGEHFTPREVIQLMVDMLLAYDQTDLTQTGIVRTVYDPCCGTGGMVNTAKDRILTLNPQADIRLYGQEVNPETFAVAKSDLYLTSADGRDADNIRYGNTLITDQHRETRFDYLLANPPYGKEWKKEQSAVESEAERGYAGRFGAGTPRISDGQLLFLQHMLAHMKPPSEGGSRIAIVLNGSPLFTGDAGSGESEIRRWILENDWLDALIALPEQLFYNTGISTYIWVLTNKKPAHRRGYVQLINAADFYIKMDRSLGDKRRRIPDEHIQQITELYIAFDANHPKVKIFPTTHFGYRKIRVERPLRLNFQASPERMARLEEQSAFKALAISKKKTEPQKSEEEAAGRELQAAIWDMLTTIPPTLYKNRAAFAEQLAHAAKAAKLKLAAPVQKAILAALSEPDETADPCLDAEGNPEPDPNLRDYESVPLGEAIEDYFAREVLPYVPDAWIDTKERDHKDGQVGKVGYEINFNRYFYRYTPPRPLHEIQEDIRYLEEKIMKLMKGITTNG